MKTARTVKVQGRVKVPPADPTRQEYGSFAAAFDYFNRELFAGTLPPCYITLQRKGGTRGYYSHERFQHRSALGRTDEIALNPSTWDDQSDDLGGRVADAWEEFNRLYFAGKLRPLPVFLTQVSPYGHWRVGYRPLE
jgi:hypothetical protein